VTLTFRRVSASNVFFFEVEMMRGAGDFLALSAQLKQKERSLVSLAARASQLETSVGPRCFLHHEACSPERQGRKPGITARSYPEYGKWSAVPQHAQ